MKACVLQSAGDFSTQHVPDPVPRKETVVLRVGACGVCGSDLPRIFGNKAHSLPLIPGHEFSGTVVELGEGVDSSWSRKRVTVFPLIPCRRCAMCEMGEYAQCSAYDYLGSRSDGAFAEYVAVPVWNLLPIPDEVTFEEAAMTEPAAVALHALRLGEITGGDTVVIFGAGPIGLMLARWAHVFGASLVCLVDIDPSRLEFARCLGMENLVDGKDDHVLEHLRDRTNGGPDLVIEGSGASSAFEQAMLVTRPFGRVVLMGNPAGEMCLSQQAYWALMRKQLSVRGTWNSVFGASFRNEWKTTVQFLAEKRFCVCNLITHRPSLDELPGLLQAMVRREVFTCKVMCLP